MKTLLEVLQSSTGYLGAKGLDNPRLETEWMLGQILGLKRMDLYLQFDRPLGEQELAPLREMVRRRAAREPLQHILGEIEFYGRRFKSDRRTLIPRPETEQLTEEILKRHNSPGRILDLGCGSGVIALTLATERSEWEVTGSDISPEALALATENAERLGLQDRVRWVESDLFAALQGPFDGVAANLPYIPSAEIDQLAPEISHDPRQALDGGNEGIEVLARVIAESPPHLAPGAWIALEIGVGQAKSLTSLLEQNGFQCIVGVPDLQGVESRFLFAQHG